jgi:hypothetical protein
MHFRNNKFRDSLSSTIKWQSFQPFASRPAIFGSYIASTCLQEHQESINILETAGANSSDSALVKNNYAFSLASLNRVSDAETAINSIDKTTVMDTEPETIKATRGLIEYRKNNPNKGRELYKSAIEGFKKKDNHRSAALATVFLAHEEKRISSEYFEPLTISIKQYIKKTNIPEITAAAKALLNLEQDE